jgi:hypothetical protein
MLSDCAERNILNSTAGDKEDIMVMYTMVILIFPVKTVMSVFLLLVDSTAGQAPHSVQVCGAQQGRHRGALAGGGQCVP